MFEYLTKIKKHNKTGRRTHQSIPFFLNLFSKMWKSRFVVDTLETVRHNTVKSKTGELDKSKYRTSKYGF